MNTSYKIALAAAVVLCALVIGYSVFVPGDSPDSESPAPSEVTERTGADPGVDSGPTTPRPLDLGTRPEARTSDPTPGNDLMSRVLSARQAAEQGATTPAVVEPETPTLPPDERDTVAAANQPVETPGSPASPGTLTFGGDTPPSIPDTVPPLPRSANAPVPPVIGGEPAVAPPPPDTSRTPDPLPPSAPAAVPANVGPNYTIKSGDTFASIARDVLGDESRWVDIAQANPLVDPRKLKIGQVIRMPTAEDIRAAEIPAPPPAGAGTTYIVREGDTLSTIAAKFYGDRNLWDIIHRANRETIGSDPDRIAAGDKLVIPPKP